MKRIWTIFLLIALTLTLAGCGSAASGDKAVQDTGTIIQLTGDSAEVTGGGAKVQDGVVTISAVGTYTLSGSLEEGQILVDTGDDAMEVTLILDGASITNSQDAALWIRQAKNLHLQLKGENRLVSGTEADLAAFDGTASGAALYAEDDLDIEGKGSLEVLGYRNNGITCKDDLDINSGSIRVLAANNGIRASESLELKGGSVTISAGHDAMKTSSADKEGKGYVEVSGGELTISDTAGDGIQAETELRISGGRMEITVTGDGKDGSSKALKAAGDIEVSDGVISLHTEEDAVSSDSAVRISGGSLSILSGGDGIQAKTTSGSGDIEVSGGSVSVFADKQALQAKGQLRISGGTVLALSDSDKQAAPDEGGLPYLRCALRGSVGDSLLLGEEEIGQAQASYKTLLYAADTLTKGEDLSVSNGRTTVSAQVK